MEKTALKKIFFIFLTVLSVWGAYSAYAQTSLEMAVYKEIEDNMVAVKGGCFRMGNSFDDGNEDEKPVHKVCVSDFNISRFEVTQDQWLAVMGNNPSHFSGCGLKCPVEMVSWDDIQAFLLRLNQLTGKKYRLPTEAEWEYAAGGGGKNQKWAGTSKESSLGNYAWYEANSNGRPHPVGQKKPNDLGLYDMTGNVWEWLGDRYGENYYRESPVDNPLGPSSGSERILRGGSWYFDSRNIRISLRLRDNPVYRNFIFGFRLALSPGQ